MKHSRCTLAAALILGVLPDGFSQSAPSPIFLWPEGKIPGRAVVQEAVQPGKEHDVIGNPTITAFPAPGQSKATPAFVICPGGGYGCVCPEREGYQVAAWLNTIGITGVVLKYRVPGNRDGALQDVERAIRTLRSHAKDWNIDPEHVGVIGFSAGGHLSARVSTNYETPAYPAIDAIDTLSCKPNFAILVYPAYLNSNGAVAPELPISAKVPPTLIVHTEDDQGFLPGSKLYHSALDAAKVPNVFLLFKTGGHGYGPHGKGDVSVWPERAKEWLKKIGAL